MGQLCKGEPGGSEITGCAAIIIGIGSIGSIFGCIEIYSWIFVLNFLKKTHLWQLNRNSYVPDDTHGFQLELSIQNNLPRATQNIYV